MRFKQFLLFLSLILAPLLIGAYSPGVVRFGRNFSASLLEPFLEGAYQTRSFLRSQRDFAVQLFKIREENQRLHEENRALREEMTALKEIKQENVRLKQLLQFQQVSKWKAVSAQVIARDLSHWSYYVFINKGSRDGIREEMPVVTGDGLVGKVVSAGSNSSRVILLIDSESRVSALVQDTRDVGLIEGTGNALLKMTYLDFRAQIGVGTTVVSSGFGGIYPKGVPIGEVVQIGEDKNKLSLYAVVKPFAHFSKLEEVLCLVNQK